MKRALGALAAALVFTNAASASALTRDEIMSRAKGFTYISVGRQ